MLCTHDSSPRRLTEKVLERPRLLQRIRWAISDPSCAYLTVFNSTPLERKLAVLLGIPLNGPIRSCITWAPSQAAGKCSARPRVEMQVGFEDLTSEAEVADALIELSGRSPGIRRAVIKLNDSFSAKATPCSRIQPT